MAKTGTQVKALAESLTEQLTLDSGSVLLWINEFLTQELGGDAMIVDYEDYDTDGIAREYLPAGIVKILKVDQYSSSSMADADYLNPYHDYETYDEYIKFDDDGYFRLHYNVIPEEITAIGDELGIDDCFFQSCSLWVAWRGLTNDDEDNAAPNSLGYIRLQEYMTEKDAAVKRRRVFYQKGGGRGGRIRNVQRY